MKTIKILALSVSMAFIGAITFNSCSDPCKDVTCENGGTCNEGDCECPEGFSGTNCEVDDCAALGCVNGTAVLGVGGCSCECDPGYEGTTCDTEQRAKFTGSYTVNEACNSGNYSYNVSVTTGSASVSTIIISNFGDYGVNVTGTVNTDGTGLTIASQQVTIGGSAATFSGTGQISGNILTISYTISSGGQSDTCTMTCTKQ